MVSDYFSVFIYFALVLLVTLAVLGVSGLFPARKDVKTKYLPYESGIKTEAHLLKERFTLHHYLVALIFLIFDIEVIFLYPWATIAKKIGPFAFYEMAFFFGRHVGGLWIYLAQRGTSMGIRGLT